MYPCYIDESGTRRILFLLNLDPDFGNGAAQHIGNSSQGSDCRAAGATSYSIFIPKARIPFVKNGARVLSRASQFEGAEVLVPVTLGGGGVRPDPFLQPPQIGHRNPALLDPFQQVLPKAGREIRETDLRQARPSRRLRIRSLPASSFRAGSCSFMNRR